MAPDVPRYYYDRGSNHLDQNDLTWALADFDQAIRLDDGDARAYSARGAIRFAQGDFAAAARDFDEAQRLMPVNPGSSLWLLAVQVRLGEASVDKLAQAVDAARLDDCDKPFFTAEIERARRGDAVALFTHAIEVCTPDRLARTGALAEARRAR